MNIKQLYITSISEILNNIDSLNLSPLSNFVTLTLINLSMLKCAILSMLKCAILSMLKGAILCIFCNYNAKNFKDCSNVEM